MRSRRTASSNGVFRLGGGTEDNDLHVRRVASASELGLAPDDPCAASPAIVSVWEPRPEERAAIACGSNVELIVLGTEQPPVTVNTTDEQPLSRPQRLSDGAAPALCLEVQRVIVDDLLALLADAGQVIADRARVDRLAGLAEQLAGHIPELDRQAEERGS
jgi:hypothetical protein